MVSTQEFKARIKQFYNFNKQEISSLVIATLVIGFVFSFKDWGEETFNAAKGVMNLLITIIIVGASLFFRLSCQKIYGLSQGYKAEFQVWYTGLGIGLIVSFLSLGKFPLALVGCVIAAHMVRQRLGEFRYGFSLWDNGMMSFWGILGNMILAIIFAIGAFFVPTSYFFTKGLIFNIIMAFCSLLPIPQLDGLAIFFGSRMLYAIAIFTVVLGTVLLLTKTKIGLIIAIGIGSLAAIVYTITGSEK